MFPFVSFHVLSQRCFPTDRKSFHKSTSISWSIQQIPDAPNPFGTGHAGCLSSTFAMIFGNILRRELPITIPNESHAAQSERTGGRGVGAPAAVGVPGGWRRQGALAQPCGRAVWRRRRNCLVAEVAWRQHQLGGRTCRRRRGEPLEQRSSDRARRAADHLRYRNQPTAASRRPRRQRRRRPNREGSPLGIDCSARRLGAALGGARRRRRRPAFPDRPASRPRSPTSSTIRWTAFCDTSALPSEAAWSSRDSTFKAPTA